MRATTDVRNLPVKLNEEELAAKAQELAESVAEEEQQREAFAAWESTMKEAAKAKKAGIYLAHAQTVRLGEIVETGIEHRNVDCLWLYTKDSAFLKRLDTGELVQVRQLRDDERQAVLGEAEVVQEPAEHDLVVWAEAAGAATAGTPTGAEIRFPNGVVVNLDDKEAAEREMETFIHPGGVREVRDATVECETCGRRMNLGIGLGPGIRPERAKTVLRRSCKYTDGRCKFVYAAGIAPAGRVEGQGE